VKAFYRRDIVQVVLPLPSNLAALQKALCEVPEGHMCPALRVKITYDLPSDSLIVSFPLDWAKEDARQAATPHD